MRYPLPVPDTWVFGNSSTRYLGIKIGGYLQSLAIMHGGLLAKNDVLMRGVDQAIVAYVDTGWGGQIS